MENRSCWWMTRRRYQGPEQIAHGRAVRSADCSSAEDALTMLEKSPARLLSPTK